MGWSNYTDFDMLCQDMEVKHQPSLDVSKARNNVRAGKPGDMLGYGKMEPSR